ncbi:hypothetical protein BCR42DRAFT_426424 [Absidia repens]|uniref:Uncharacterized protein n=1 Tax=Absidia repens TaxID=90262 RepID=A0A1X2I1G3_9FUNG|nr:hypothetical protein BCR42DRAFT_426424 [Absidia repens]
MTTLGYLCFKKKPVIFIFVVVVFFFATWPPLMTVLYSTNNLSMMTEQAKERWGWNLNPSRFFVLQSNSTCQKYILIIMKCLSFLNKLALKRRGRGAVDKRRGINCS